MEFYEPFSKHQPFKSPFVIKNEGNSDLSNIFLKKIELDKIVYNTPQYTNIHIDHTTDSYNIILKENLEPNKSHTFTFDFLYAFSTNTAIPTKEITSANGQIKIFISYYWFYIKQEETFSFKIITYENGIIKWAPIEE